MAIDRGDVRRLISSTVAMTCSPVTSYCALRCKEFTRTGPPRLVLTPTSWNIPAGLASPACASCAAPWRGTENPVKYLDQR